MRGFRIDFEGKCVESHDTLKGASRAFWILVAHEAGRPNGNPTGVVLQGGHALPAKDCDLPSWAREILGVVS